MPGFDNAQSAWCVCVCGVGVIEIKKILPGTAKKFL